nr:salicylate carboxymethyltransferase-like [Ipomoea batatas]
MNVAEVLRMNGGNGHTSYANNSLVQRNVIHMTKPIIEQAMTSLYTSLDNPKTISIADLGCSSGPNTLLAVSNLVKAVDDQRKKLRRRHSPEFQIYLNDDLPPTTSTPFSSHCQNIGGRYQVTGVGCVSSMEFPVHFMAGFSPPTASILFILLIVSIGYLKYVPVYI